MALAVVLLVSAGLLVLQLRQHHGARAGVDVDHVVAARLQLRAPAIRTDADVVRFYRTLTESSSPPSPA
jgi:hypothetical protein